MKVVLVKGVNEVQFKENLEKVKSRLSGHNRIYVGADVSNFEIEVYDTGTKVTLRGAEAIAELLKDPYES